MDGELISGKQDFEGGSGQFVDSGTTMLYLTSAMRR